MGDLRVGGWLVEPAMCRVSRDGSSIHVRAKVMDLLVYLAAHRLEVLPKEQLLDSVWGTREISESAMTRTVAELRQALGDDVAEPRFLETIPKRGYRFIAPVAGAATAGAAESSTRVLDAPTGGGEQSCVQQHGDVAAAGPHQSGTRATSIGLRITLGACVLILVASAWWSASLRRSGEGTVVSLAVLPFSAVAGGDEYIARAMTDGVARELGGITGLRVLSSGPSAGAGQAAAISPDGGVDVFVRGTVQRADATARLEVSLVDGNNGRALWSHRYDDRNTELAVIPREVALQVAATLSRRSRAPLAAPARANAATQAEAHHAYLRGLWQLKSLSTPDAIIAHRGARRLTAVRELERAVALDGTFAPAHAALASAYTQRVFYDAPDPTYEERAFIAIQRALALDPRLAEAYVARAQLTWSHRHRFPHDAAITDLKRAVSIDPGLSAAYAELGKIYYHLGLTDRALAANERAHQLDPAESTSISRRFRMLIDAGRLDLLTGELDRRLNVGRYAHADALLALGEPEQARQVLAAAIGGASGDVAADTATVALLGVAQASLGQRVNAERTIRSVAGAAENVAGFSHMHHAQFHIGAALAVLGRHDEAVHWLTKAADEGYPSYPRYSTDKTLTSLKGHARFEALLRRLEQDWRRWTQRH
jgi:DNA-binding winged helix-turn-helix (wHTH) protein/TolB-like protein